jgi:hypothetical protein
MAKPEQDEHLQEAIRIAPLPPEVRDRIISQFKTIAKDPKLPKPDRDKARTHATLLERHLRRLLKKRS